MGPRIRKRHHGRIAVASSSDANDTFVRSVCLGYMSRIMAKYELWDHETLTFLGWLLGDSFADLSDAACDMAPEGTRSELTQRIGEVCGYEDKAGVIARALEKCSKSALHSLRQYALTIIDRERECLGGRTASPLARNLDEFTRMFGLSDQETELCLFLALMASWTPVERFFDTHLDCDRYAGRKYLLAALGVSATRFEGMAHGRLRRLGFIDLDRSWLELTKDALPLINESAQAVLTRDHYRPLPKPSVALTDHVVQVSDLDHLMRLLAQKQASATHVLLYGPPGTGKSSFAQALGATLDCPAYEVMHHAENKALSRRMGLTACLNLTNHGTGSLIVVDEADNLLNTDDGWLMRGESQDKGWLNGLLEEPGARVIWITNRVENIDPSVRRRFAYSLHFPPFGKKQRARLWESILRKHRVKRFFKDAEIVEFAAQHDVSAGVIDIAVSKARESGFSGKGDLLDGISRSLAAHKRLTHNGRATDDRHQPNHEYVAEALNLDCRVDGLVHQVRSFDEWWRRPAADRPVQGFNLLFHGPSGTGKTALARHLADLMDRTLIVKLMSALLGPYVGQTERALADAFSQAQAEDGILLIDEADSLLFPRNRAQRSWEVSFTNEFLTQMEQLKGMLICTTNRAEDLDSAAMRRFARKVEFRHLEADGITTLYRRILAPLVERPLKPTHSTALAGLDGVTPAMFTVVRNNLMLYSRVDLSHDRLIEELSREAYHSTKTSRRQVGFNS